MKSPAEVSVLDYGAISDGSDDSSLAIQAALDSGACRVVIPAGVYSIRRALCPAENQCVVLNGTLRFAPSEQQKLLSDVKEGDRHLSVADPSRYSVGEWVTLHDDQLPIQGGGRKVRRQNAGSATIVAIDGGQLTLDRASARNYSVAANAQVARQHSGIWIRHSGVRICGTGVIDGNYDNQLNAAPCLLDQFKGEVWQIASGIVASAEGGVRKIVIEGVTVRDCTLHGIGLRNAEESTIRNVRCEAVHDKGITLWNCRDCVIESNFCCDSRWEDGIMLHQVQDPAIGSSRILIRGNVCRNNARYGIHIGSNMSRIALAHNLCVDNGLNLSIYGDDCSSTGDYAVGTTDRLFTPAVYRPNVQVPGNRITLTNLTALGTRYVGVELCGSDLTLSSSQIGDMEGPCEPPKGEKVIRVIDGKWGRGSGDFYIDGDCRIGVAVVQGMNGRGDPQVATRIRIVDCGIRSCRAGLRISDAACDVSLGESTFHAVECVQERSD